MEFKEAVGLLAVEVKIKTKQRWADLGAGSGFFTLALASLLADGSEIHAVDKDKRGLDQVAGRDKVTIIKVNLDFINSALPLKDLDGILMANSIHYVSDKVKFLNSITSYLKPGGTIILVEYDTDRANAWVPHPISFNSLQLLIDKSTNGTVKKIGETTSRYQSSGMYSAVITLPRS